MTRRYLKESTEPYYMVKVGFHGFFLTFATRNEPDFDGVTVEQGLADAKIIREPGYNDVPVFVDEEAVISISWRLVESKK
jgi:hypothetical protein